MFQHLRACLWLVIVTVVLCCVVYPLVLLGIGKMFFPKQAAGSLIERNGKTVGSSLIAQPFTADKYFQSRPSAVSYNAAASGASNWAANNYLLRDRVARQLGPVVKYTKGRNQPVAPDIEAWFQKDRFGGKPGIVAQWAGLHPTVAGTWLHDWVKADTLNATYVAAWEAANPDVVDKWKSENAFDPNKPEDLAAGVAVAFFTSFSKDHPGAFPGVAEYDKDGKTAKTIGPVKKGSDIQSLFFDMWLSDHPDADLRKVPADVVMASGSGLDPHITLDNARWQLDNLPIVAAWAKSSKKDPKTVYREIRKLLDDKNWAPLGGRLGVPLVNVLEINLALEDHFHEPAAEKAEKQEKNVER
ncbi:MAG: potassium-transporting ATPase subunit C [Thermoguttaceae bacterium]